MRSTGTRPAPRSMRAGNVSHRSLAPVVSAIERASASDASRHAVPPTSSTAGSPDRSTCAIVADRVVADRAPRRGCLGCGDLAALAPRDVGRQHERRDLTGRTERRGHRVGRVRADLAGLRRPADEPRHVARHRLDVGLELRVVLLVVRRVVADDVDDRRLALARVVQVGEPVAEARPEVQQGGRGPAGHAAVAVGRAGRDAFEQREHAAHLGHRVERGDEVHLRRARVHEAGVDTARNERADECLGAVHDVSLSFSPGPPESKIVPGLRMPCGSNAALMRRINASFTGSSSSSEVRLLLGADAVLARDRAAELHARGEHVADQVVPHVRVLLEHREVDVAVARVAAADDERSVPLRELRHRGHVLRDRRARHDHVDDVVGACRLRGPERLLARLDELGARGRRQHVHVEGAERAEQLGQLRGVLLEPVVVPVFQHHHEVRERLFLDLRVRRRARRRARVRWRPS